MPKVKALVRGGGMWPDAPAPAHYSTELTIAAKRLAESVLKELKRLGVTVALDKAGRAHFRSRAVAPPAARRMIEVHGDLVESYLREQTERESGG